MRNRKLLIFENRYVIETSVFPPFLCHLTLTTIVLSNPCLICNIKKILTFEGLRLYIMQIIIYKFKKNSSFLNTFFKFLYLLPLSCIIAILFLSSAILFLSSSLNEAICYRFLENTMPFNIFLRV